MTATWPYVPGTVLEHLAFYTDVKQTYLGEDREGITDAIQSFEFTHRLQDFEGAQSQELFRTNPLGQWYVPVWHDMTVPVDVSAGATSIAVNTDADWRVGDKAIILLDNQNWELVDVSSVGSGSISVSAVVGAYAGATVAPVRLCYATAGLTTSSDQTVVDVSVKFQVIDAVDLSNNPYSLLDGFYVVTDPPDVVSPVSGGIAQAFQLIDSGFGAFEPAPQEGYVRPRYMVSFQDWDDTVRWNRRRWLHAVRGRDAPFLLPSFKNDLQVQTGVAAGSVSLQVSHVLQSSADYAGRYIVVDNGIDPLSPTKITSASVAGGIATLTLPALAVDVPTTSIVSFMNIMRLDTDVIDITHSNLMDGILSAFQAVTLGVVA